MSAKQVEQFLGEDPLRLTVVSSEIERGTILRVHDYRGLGLWVITTERAGVLQVWNPAIRFQPLLD
jgi:hypothetical protein